MSYLRPPSRSAARAFLAARASAGGAPVGGGGAVADRPGLGVPGYAHPLVAPVEWAELARPGVPLDWVAVHVAAGGAGARADPYCAAAIAALRGTGVEVLGRLDLRRGTRDFGEVLREAHHFLEWYGVDGFYLARAPSGRDGLAGVERVTTTLRALAGAGDGVQHRMVLDPECHPHRDYVELADQLVTFSGPWHDYRWSQVAEWTADHPSHRFCHLVHGVPATHLDEAVRIARWQGAGTVYLTDRTRHEGLDPWESLPGYWDEIVSKLGPDAGE
ncbi:spherulation-specific family 4 protein [Streptomyces sp. P38-E01]|uniref:Spherulation-specific family 4 protein n=1 Tax=Streptomyces tardus TaxID=2780544 RepID=A0A949N958_9ACTN|nr:spherulation-specific family 4 protein [Streptomyces tardus]MBU7599256.1 spherulation-specific family 4 protein [Streptomyces tardus]